MPQNRLFGVDGCKIDKKVATCDMCSRRTVLRGRARLTLLAMVILAMLVKQPVLAQTSMEGRQISFATGSQSNGPEARFQGERKGIPLLGCFSTQDAVAAILSGGQQ